MSATPDRLPYWSVHGRAPIASRPSGWLQPRPLGPTPTSSARVRPREPSPTCPALVPQQSGHPGVAGREYPCLPDVLGGQATEPLVAGGLKVRAALRGDLHSTLGLSDGGSSIQEMAVTAMDLGHEYLVLTDHSPRLKIANGLSSERLIKQLRVIEGINSAIGPVPPAQGHRGRHPRRWWVGSSDQMLAQLDLRVPQSTPSSRCRQHDDRPDDRRRTESAEQYPRSLHRAAGRGLTRDSGPEFFDAAAVFEACALMTSLWRSMHVRSAATHPTSSCWRRAMPGSVRDRQ